MELYSSHPAFSMSMAHDPILYESLIELVKSGKIEIAIETGTYLGTGSTKLIADCLQKNSQPKRFVTIEVDFSNWCHAKANLRPYAFIDCLWGCTVEIDEGLKFIETDEMIINHKAYDGIYIDDIIDPVQFYTREIRAQHRFSENLNIRNDAQTMLWGGEGLLSRLLQVHGSHCPLIILDSAGGIGFMEFQVVLEYMQGKQFFLLLDDTHHIKHYRSMLHVRKSEEFMLLAEGESWILASHL